MKNWIEM